MKIINFFSLFCFIALLSCKDDNSTPNDNIGDGVETQSYTITTKSIARFRYNDYALSNDAKEVVSSWSKFQELSTQITFLKKADLTFFTTEKDTLKVFLNNLKADIPEKLNTNPINSRISVLETKLLKLNNDLVLDNYSKENKLESIKELLISNSNLIYLINKKLEFDKNDVGRPEE